MKAPIILAVDVSKGYGDFVLMDVTKRVLVEHFRLDDTSEGHRILKGHLKHWKKYYASKRIILVAESSGGYEDNWVRLAKDKALKGFVESYRINPKIIYHEYEAQRRSSIDDGVSAHTIAEHVAKNLEQFPSGRAMPDEIYQPARSLIRHLVRLEKESTGHKNALLKLLYQYLPSLEAVKPDGWPAYWLEILARYGSRKSIQMAAAKGFRQLKRLPKGKAQQIAKALAQGIDPRQTSPMVVLTIQSKARQIQRLAAEIKQLEEVLVQTAPVDAEQVTLLKSIKGMGPVSPIVLLCFIEQVDRFDNAKQMAAFFGLQPRIKNSGDGRYKSKMSKQGAALVRRELYLLAFRCLSTQPYLKSIYAKHRAKGMTHDAALGVLMHKLIRIIYGMLNSNTEFDAGIDQLNQRPIAHPATSHKPKHNAVRRFQAPSLDAPISCRQRKKRKKDHELQADGISESTESS